MPEIGEIKKGNEVGKNYNGHFMWVACPVCEKQRWVTFINGKPKWQRCLACANRNRFQERNANMTGDNNPNWKGGRRITEGYIAIKLDPSDFFYSMVTKDGYVLEHRLVVAKHLKRCLLPWEVVHHKNGVRNDNRLENLELLLGQGKHNTMINKRIKQLEDTVNKQAMQIKLLQWQISELEKNKTKGGEPDGGESDSNSFTFSECEQAAQR